MALKDLVYNLVLNAKGFVSGAGEAGSAVEGIAAKATPAFNAVAAKIEELKAKLTGMKGAQLTLVDPAAIAMSEIEIKKLEAEIKTASNTLANIAKRGEPEFSKLDHMLEKAREKFSELAKQSLGIFGGGAMIGAAMGMERAFDGIMEHGTAALQMQNKMRQAFAGNTAEIKEQSEHVEEISAKYGINEEHLMDLSANARLTAHATGDFNKNLVELGAGLEKLHLPGIDAISVMKGLTMGAGSEEGQEGIGRLNRAFPILASGLAGITDPAEKTKKALELMSPVLAQVAEDAQGPAEAGNKLSLELDRLQKDVGEKVVPMIAGTFIPVIGFLVRALDAFVKLTDEVPGPVLLIAKVIGGLTLVVIAATVAEKLHLVAKIASFIQTGKDIVIKGIHNAALIAGAVATGVQTAATWLLNGAMVALTSPVSLIVIAIAALAGGLIYAYNHSEVFRNAVKAMGSAVETAVMFFLKWLNPIGLLVQGLMALYDKVEFVKKAVDGAISIFKSAATSLGLMSDKSKELTEGQKEAVAVIEAETKALEEQTAARAKLIAGLDEHEKALKDNVDKAAGQAYAVRVAIDEIKQHGHAMLANAKGVMSEVTTQDLAFLEDNLAKTEESARAHIAVLHGLEASKDDEMKRLGLAKDEKVEKPKKEKDDAIKILQDQYATEKSITESAFKDRSTALEKQVASGLLTLEQGKIGALLIEGQKSKSLLDLAEKYNEQSKTMLTKDQLAKLTALAGEKSIISEHLTDVQREHNLKITQANATLKALQEFQARESDADLTHAKSLEAQTQLSNDAEMAELKAHLADMDLKFKKSHAQQLQNEQESRELRDAALEMSQMSAFDKDIQRTNNAEADQLLALNEAHQANLDAEALYLAKREAIKATADSKEKTAELQALDDGHEAVLTNEALYEARKTKVAADAEAKRYQIEVGNFTKNNLLYRAGDIAFGSMLTSMSSKLKSFFDGTAKAQMAADKKSLTDLQKSNADKLVAMQKDVADNKLSYQDYVDEKVEMDQEYADKKTAIDEKGKVDYSKILSDVFSMFVDAGQKMIQEELQNTMKRIGIKEVDAQAGATAGLFSTMPPFVALALEAGIMLAITGLFSALAPKADAGMFVDAANKGGKLITIGEKRPEFAVTEDDFKTYSEKRLTPMLEKTFATNLMKNPAALRTFQTLQNGPPRIHPGVSQQATRDMKNGQQEAKRLNDLLDHLATNGLVATIGEDHFQNKLRKSGKSIESATRERNGSVNRRSGVNGGGYGR